MELCFFFKFLEYRERFEISQVLEYERVKFKGSVIKLGFKYFYFLFIGQKDDWGLGFIFQVVNVIVCFYCRMEQFYCVLYNLGCLCDFLILLLYGVVLLYGNILTIFSVDGVNTNWFQGLEFEGFIELLS